MVTLTAQRAVVFDFDGTVTPDPGYSEEIPPPRPEMVALMRKARAAGLKIVIASCRWSVHELNTPAEAERNMVQAQAYLDEWGIPYDELRQKPLGEFYCDDKAIHADDLDGIERAIAKAKLALVMDENPQLKPLFEEMGFKASLSREELEAQGYRFEINLTEPYEGTVEVFSGFNRVGLLRFVGPDEGDYIFPSSTSVNDEHQRLGLATTMYDMAEEATGRRMEPSDDLSDEAKALWRDRLKDQPEVAERLKSWIALEASGDNHEWGCLMVDFPEELAEQARSYAAANIPDDALYLDPEDPSGYGRETHVHTTVAYGLDPKMDRQRIADLVAGISKPVKVRLGKISKFEPEKYDVIKVEVESPDLHELHDQVKALGVPGETYPEYKPHLTLAYVQKGAADHLLGQTPFEGQEFELTQFDYSAPPAPGDKDKHTKYEAGAGVKAAQLSFDEEYKGPGRKRFWITPELKIIETDGALHEDALEWILEKEWKDLKEATDSDGYYYNNLKLVDIAKSRGFRRGLIVPRKALAIGASDDEMPKLIHAAERWNPEWVLVQKVVSHTTEVNVDEGEDAASAWTHRNDIRHRVAAAYEDEDLTNDQIDELCRAVGSGNGVKFLKGDCAVFAKALADFLGVDSPKFIAIASGPDVYHVMLSHNGEAFDAGGYKDPSAELQFYKESYDGVRLKRTSDYEMLLNGTEATTSAESALKSIQSKAKNLGIAATFEDEGRNEDGYWGSAASGILYRSADGKVLLLKRSSEVDEPGTWGIPGGAIPVDDATGQPKDAQASALTEAGEEMGGRPEASMSGSSVFRDGEFTFTTFFGRVADTSFKPSNLGWESDAWGWFGFDELPSPLHPGVAKTLDGLGVQGTRMDSEAEKVLPPDVLDAFYELGSAQRDVPEGAMLDAQRALGGGVLSHLVEHVGDLTNRLTHDGTAMNKATMALRMLTRPYGFLREHEENMANNANYTGVSLETYKARVQKTLDAYVRAHRALPVYNRVQWLARQAAIDIASLDVGAAKVHLEEFIRLSPTPARLEFKKDEAGKLLEFKGSVVNAGLSSVLYHSTTGPENATSIINSDKFQLSVAQGSDAKLLGVPMPKGKFYYLSTSRSLAGAYGRIIGDVAATLVLDGDSLADRYSGDAVDYWGPEFRRVKPEGFEMEDRVWSKDSMIPNATKYITAVLAYLNPKEPEDNQKRAIRALALAAKTKGLPFRLYTDKKAYGSDNEARAVPVTSLDLETPPAESYKTFPRSAPEDMEGLVELFRAPVGSKLTPKAEKVRNAIVYHDYAKENFVRRAEADLHNNRRGGRADSLVEAMREAGVTDVKALVDQVADKWRVPEAVAASRKTPGIVPKILYHGSSQDDRESIQRQGLLVSKSQTSPFVFLTDTLAPGKYDIWEVNTNGLSLYEEVDDPSAEDERWFTSEKDIPPSALKLRPSNFKPVAASLTEYPKAGGSVSGLAVRDEVPNTGSISSSLDDYEELPGIREVPIDDIYSGDPHSYFYAKDDFDRSKELATEIESSGEISPIIVVVGDPSGPYTLEGAHRVVALGYLKKKSVPALVVRDLAGSHVAASLTREQGKDAVGQAVGESIGIAMMENPQWVCPSSKMEKLIDEVMEKLTRWGAFEAYAKDNFGVPFRAHRVFAGADLVFTDRYQALGIPYPEPGTCCPGQCEGTGVVPVCYKRPAGYDGPMVADAEDDPELIKAWEAAEALEPTDDGWHFVQCPACGGTGKIEASSGVVKFWITPMGDFNKFDPKDEHDPVLEEMDPNYSYGTYGAKFESGSDAIEEAMRTGWVRGGIETGEMYIQLDGSEDDVEQALGNIPAEFTFVKSLSVQFGAPVEIFVEVPVLEGEDALDAWTHRKDIRHRVKAESGDQKFWVSPDNKVFKVYTEHYMELTTIAPELEQFAKNPLQSGNLWWVAKNKGWGRVRIAHGQGLLIDADQSRVEDILKALPLDSIFVTTLFTDEEEIPVLEGEDALDAWRHRKDVRHRVKSSLGVRGEALNVVGYHGTRVKDELFDEVGLPGEDYYVTTDDGDAEWYATDWKTSGTPAIIKGKLTLKNVIIIDTGSLDVFYGGETQDWDDFMRAVLGLDADNDMIPEVVLPYQKYITDYADQNGFDGVVFTPGFSELANGDDVAVFDPSSFKEEQIKLKNPDGEWTDYISFNEARAELKKMTAVEAAAKLSIPKGVAANVKGFDGTLAGVDGWQARIVLGNNLGRDKTKKKGGWDGVGYVMVNPTSGSIVPVALSDEHQTGFDLLYHYQDLGLLDVKGFRPLTHGMNYLDMAKPANLKLLSFWLDNGGPDAMVAGTNREQGRMSDWIAGQGTIKTEPGKLAAGGKEWLQALEKFSKLWASLPSDREPDEDVVTDLFDAAYEMREVGHRWKFLWASPGDVVDRLFTTMDYKGLGNVVLGMAGVKNKVHTKIKELLDDSKDYEEPQFRSFFGDLELAKAELDRLGAIRGADKREQAVIDILLEDLQMAKAFKALPGWSSSEEMIRQCWSEDFVEHVENYDGQDPRSAAEGFRENFERAYWEVEQFVHQSKVKVYRMLALDLEEAQAFVEAAKEGKPLPGKEGFGIYWTHNPDKADSYWGHGSEEVLLQAEAPTSSVNWKTTLVHQVIFSDEEDEITMKAGSPLTLKTVRWITPIRYSKDPNEPDVDRGNFELNIQIKAAGWDLYDVVYSEKFYQKWKDGHTDGIQHYVDAVGADDPTDEEYEARAKELFQQEADRTLSEISDLPSQSTIDLWRMITVHPENMAEFLSALSNEQVVGEYSGIGTYWSYVRESAEAHWGGGGKKVRLHGQVSSSDVDWEATVDLQMDPDIGDNEDEIRLRPGVPVNIVGVEIDGKEKKMEHPFLLQANKFDDLYKAAVAISQDDAKYSMALEVPALAQEQGQFQQAVKDARSEAELQQAWTRFQPSVGWDAFQTMAEGAETEAKEPVPA